MLCHLDTQIQEKNCNKCNSIKNLKTKARHISNQVKVAPNSLLNTWLMDNYHLNETAMHNYE